MALATIHLRQRRLSDYATALEPDTVEVLRRLAEPLAGRRVLHLSAGPFGSAVAETLAGLVPLQRDLGILADWRVLRDDAHQVAALLYEGLRGRSVRWRRKERAAWFAYAARQVAEIGSGYDVIVAHDPQAIALAEALPASAGRPRWVWHCHLDTRAADPEVWDDVRRALEPYAAALFPAPELVRRDCPTAYQGVAAPVIDPCAPKNLPLPPGFAAAMLERLGLDPNRPLIGQFAPIDQPHAALAALGTYWIARREIPGLQIVLADLSWAPGERTRRASQEFDAVVEAAAGDPRVHLLTGLAGLGPTALNALQRTVVVGLQLAVPAGFGWGIAECQWKGRPVIVGRHGFLPAQVGDGAGGYLVEGCPDAAAAVVQLLRDPDWAAELGRRGQQQVARHFLLPRLLADYLRLFHRIVDPAGSRPVGGPVGGSAPVDRPLGQTGWRDWRAVNPDSCQAVEAQCAS